MDNEIDLRRYIEILLRHWKWIVGLTILGAIVGIVLALLTPPTYEASAVVMVTQPRYRINLDPRFQTSVETSPAYKAFPKLAESDEILQSVTEVYAPSPESGIEDWDLLTLAGMVDAGSEGDPSLLLLTVRGPTSQDATGIANVWADVLVQRGNEIYSGSDQDVVFFEKQVSSAEQAWDEANAALIEFQAQNEANLVEVQLKALSNAQADYLDTQYVIAQTLQDIQGLRQQLASQPEGNTAALANSLSAILLQIKAFNASSRVPITLQVGGDEFLVDTSAEEQIAFLDELAIALETKSAEVEARLVEIEPEMMALQQKLQEIEGEEERLTRSLDLARDTHLTLTRKLEEARITAGEQNGILQVGSYAIVRPKPAAPSKKMYVVGGAGLGFVVSMALTLVLEIIRVYRSTTPSDNRGDAS